MSTETIADYYVAERPEFISFVRHSGPFENAIDIGCAGGKLGASLLSNHIV